MTKPFSVRRGAWPPRVVRRQAEEGEATLDREARGSPAPRRPGGGASSHAPSPPSDWFLRNRRRRTAAKLEPEAAAAAVGQGRAGQAQIERKVAPQGAVTLLGLGG